MRLTRIKRIHRMIREHALMTFGPPAGYLIFPEYEKLQCRFAVATAAGLR
jgi:hypothetical protein